MKRFTLFCLTILVALGLALGLPAAARPDEDVRPEDNFAIAINTRDDSLRFRRAFEVFFTSSDVIDNANAAVAYASCERCRTIAIAVQAVIVSGSPSQVVPENVGLAINDGCSFCETLASAYQFVVGGGEPLSLTPEGSHRINAIRYEIRVLGRSGLPLAEIQARLDVLMDELEVVLETELVPSGTEDGDDSDDGDDWIDPMADTVGTTPVTQTRSTQTAIGRTTTTSTTTQP